MSSLAPRSATEGVLLLSCKLLFEGGNLGLLGLDAIPSHSSLLSLQNSPNMCYSFL